MDPELLRLVQQRSGEAVAPAQQLPRPLADGRGVDRLLARRLDVGGQVPDVRRLHAPADVGLIGDDALDRDLAIAQPAHQLTSTLRTVMVPLSSATSVTSITPRT